MLSIPFTYRWPDIKIYSMDFENMVFVGEMIEMNFRDMQ
jgi:hypothetical protein